jgi:hypothetical protein
MLVVVPGLYCSGERQDVVLDIVFVAVSVVFFAVSLGYVALCDRLMK